MSDNFVTGISQNGGVVVHVVDSTQIVAEMERLHTTSATASAALGRLLTAATLMGKKLKSEGDSITLSVNGGGPVGTLTAIGEANGNVRGKCTNPRADLPLNQMTGKLDVGGLVGVDGNLTVVRDIGLKEPYLGQVPLVSGEIAEDITAYYAQSEQTPTVCALGVLVNPDLKIRAAGGYLLQLMPGATEAEIALVEHNIGRLDSVSAMIDRGMTPAEIAFAVLDGFSPELLETATAQYHCDCSREKMERALISIGKAELQQLAKEQPETELVCSYCNNKYHFSSAELLAL